jgi:hypothetical protein
VVFYCLFTSKVVDGSPTLSQRFLSALRVSNLEVGIGAPV